MQAEPILAMEDTQKGEAVDLPLNVDLEIIPIDDYYAIRPTVEIPEQRKKDYVQKSFILFAIECRSGMNEQAVKMLRKYILDMIEEFINKGIDGMGFVVNEEYYPMRNFKSYEAAKDMLQKIDTREEVSFEKTLIKLRHTIQTEVGKLENKKLTLIFFSSPVSYDKTNPHKQSYLNYLNRHHFDYSSEISRLRKTIYNTCSYSQSHVIGFRAENQPVDTDFLVQLTYCAHRFGYYQIVFSFNGLEQIFKNVGTYATSLMSGLTIKIPKIYNENQQNPEKFIQCKMYPVMGEDKFTVNSVGGFVYAKKSQINLDVLKYQGYEVEHDILKQQKLRYNFSQKCVYIRNELKAQFLKFEGFKSHYNNQPTFFQLINCRASVYCNQLAQISHQLINSVIKIRKVRDVNGKHHEEKIFYDDLLFALKMRIEYIDKVGRQIHDALFQKFNKKGDNQIRQIDKGKLYLKYSYLKNLLDQTQFTLTTIFKHKIGDFDIGRLTAAITDYQVKRSLRNKLVKRINANPRMLDQVYEKIHNIRLETNDADLYSMEAKYKVQKSEVGNCCESDCNFVTSLMDQDCLALMFEVERPEAAIADPGRLRMRQVSPFVIRVSKFFLIHYHGVQNNMYCPDSGDAWIRSYNQVYKQGYQQMWDYWNRADRQKVAIGIMPLYITEQHWKTAKLLMKPCLAWTACMEPLAYTFSQTQTIPFMVLSYLIRKNQQLLYRIDEIEKEAQQVDKLQKLYQKQQERNIVRLQQSRIAALMKHAHLTCQQILKDCSGKNFEQKMIDNIVQKYTNYDQPIRRTLDIINSNPSFIAQIYCAITTGLMEKPTQSVFHQFFKRLIEEELRRQTDGWYEQEIQDKFVNKLLNSEIEEMTEPVYIAINSAYRDSFEECLKGRNVLRTQFEIERQKLSMMVKKNNKFNETQQMTLVEYKRLYENRVLWMWYVRFLIYNPWQRKEIHKWKCLDLTNSYQLFTMIIQNKKQRKNYKRREAILKGQYADPYDYYESVEYLESEFMKLRNKKESKNIKLLNEKKYGNSSAVFAQSPDLQEAAGALLNAQMGKQIPYYYQALISGKANLVHHKLRMLLLGEYMGVSLIKGGGWKMNKSKNLQMEKKYPLEFSKYRYMC